MKKQRILKKKKWKDKYYREKKKVDIYEKREIALTEFLTCELKISEENENDELINITMQEVVRQIDMYRKQALDIMRKSSEKEVKKINGNKI